MIWPISPLVSQLIRWVDFNPRKRSTRFLDQLQLIKEGKSVARLGSRHKITNGHVVDLMVRLAVHLMRRTVSVDVWFLFGFEANDEVHRGILAAWRRRLPSMPGWSRGRPWRCRIRMQDCGSVPGRVFADSAVATF
jgi:hypothetical protein